MRSHRIVSLVMTVLVATLVQAGALGAAKTPKAPKPPPPRYLFAAVPWLTPGDSAQAALVGRGYQPVAGARDSQQVVLRGKLFEHDAVITGHLDERGRLLRWVVLIGTRGDPFPFPDMRAVFDEVGKETEARYGAPRTVSEKYSFPYERGDGREDKALRDGKAVIRRTWASGSGDRLTVEMDANVSVVLTYECREWEALEKRRQAKRSSDL